MSGKILALVENNIGAKLLLSTRLGGLGYRVTVLSAQEAFRQRMAAEAFDWLILDEAAVGPVRRRLLLHLSRHRKGAGIVWLGCPPRESGIRIEAAFDKPVSYDEIVRFFSELESRDDRPAATARRGDGVPRPPGVETSEHSCPGHEGAGPRRSGRGRH